MGVHNSPYKIGPRVTSTPKRSGPVPCLISVPVIFRRRDVQFGNCKINPGENLLSSSRYPARGVVAPAERRVAEQKKNIYCFTMLR